VGAADGATVPEVAMVMVDDIPILSADATDVKWNFIPLKILNRWK
jgi:hypothetical protein